MTIKVWLPSQQDRYYLRFLFPSIKFVMDSPPVYSSVIFSDFSYPVGDDRVLFLLSDPSGFPLNQIGGFSKFLSQLQYLDDKKLNQLLRYQYPDMQSMFLEAFTLKYHNRSWSSIHGLTYAKNQERLTDEDRKAAKREESQNSFPAKVSQAVLQPFGERLKLCGNLGYVSVLHYLLSAFHKFWSREMTGFTREFFAPVASAFNRQAFLSEFEFSEDPEIDCCLLLSYFR